MVHSTVTTMLVESVHWIFLGIRLHDSISAHLGNDRCQGHGITQGIPVDHGTANAGTILRPAVSIKNGVGFIWNKVAVLLEQGFDTLEHGLSTGRRDLHGIDFFRRGRGDRPGKLGWIRRDDVVDFELLLSGQLLGIVHTDHRFVVIFENGNRRCHQRSRPRTRTARFVHSNHVFVALEVAQLLFVGLFSQTLVSSALLCK
mmetsp:Transcript_37542/g.57589  ORF Transcript_37542/g.57589 Transcript_37542/m.57589 type:complete len:201 (+) Transcript_37542:156-758(+)